MGRGLGTLSADAAGVELVTLLTGRDKRRADRADKLDRRSPTGVRGFVDRHPRALATGDVDV